MKNRTQKIIHTLSTLITVLLLSTGLSAQGWQLTFYASASQQYVGGCKVIDISESNDGYSHVISTYDRESKVDMETTLVLDRWKSISQGIGAHISDDWDNHHLHPKAIISNDKDYAVIAVDCENASTGENSAILAWCGATNENDYPKLDILYNITSLIEDGTFSSKVFELTYTPDSQLVALGALYNEASGSSFIGDLVLTKFTLDGTPSWTQQYESTGDDIGVKVIATADGAFRVLKNVQSVNDEMSIQLMSLDANGAISSTQTIGSSGDSATDMIQTTDGGLAIVGHNADQNLFVLKLDSTGAPMWQQEYTAPDRIFNGHSITQDKQEHFVVAGRISYVQDNITHALLAKLSPDGIPLWERFYEEDENDAGFNSIITQDDGKYLMGGYTKASESTNSDFSLLIKTDTFGIIKGGAIHGNVYYDLNLSCLPDPDELKLEGWTIQIVGDSTTYFGITNDNGDYWIPVDVEVGTTPTYTVSVITPNHYWEACTNDVAITLSYLDTLQVEFPMLSVVECPMMTAEISNTIYSENCPSDIYINYRNTGTAIAEDASIVVTLDEQMLFNTSSIPPALIDGSQYTFELGDLAVNESGQLIINVFLDASNIEEGDILCVEAQLSPDTICNIDNQWSGALLQLSNNCEGDDLVFTIENVGTAPMQGPLSYIIIEDAVLLMEEEFELAPGESIETDALATDGSNFQLLSPQEPYAPGPNWLSLGSDNCSTANSDNQYPQNSGDPFIITHCNPVIDLCSGIGCFANPTGFSEENTIMPNSDITYSIYFENNTSNKVSRVTVRDTLSEHLDPATIIPGPSSHPYDFRFEGENVIVFNFYNLHLTPAENNLSEANGFVSFKIRQKKNLEAGTRIENKAGIYFDFNKEVSTNTTFHTVGDFNGILYNSTAVARPDLEVSVIPNPMQNGAWISINTLPNQNQALQLSLYDLHGKRVKEAQSNNNKIWLARDQLAPGIYFFSIHESGQWVANGKIIIVN